MSNSYVESPFLDAGEAAQYLRIPRSTLYQLTHRRLIPFHKRGKKLYFKVVDLDNWAVGDDSRTPSHAELEREVAAEMAS
jgi:excisionase family DNA binding protein